MSRNETKIMLNSRISVIKSSSIEKKIQGFMVFTVGLQIIICLVLAILNRVWLLSHPQLVSYFRIEVSRNSEYLKTATDLTICFMRWVLLTE